MQLIVLGMHRSGTSSVTRLLNLAGAYFGPEGASTEPNDENPKGFWERRDVRDVCDALLRGGGFDWWRIADFAPGRVPDEVREEQTEAFRRIVLQLDAHRPWVLKEPRLCLLSPILRATLEAPVFVHVTREPVEIAESLSTRNGFPVPVGLALWEAYTLGSLAASGDDPRVLVSYSDLMADPVGTTGRLIEQLSELGVQGLRPPTDREVTAFISPSLHRHRQPVEDRLGLLNATQAALALDLDEQRWPELDDPPSISPGALATLRAFEQHEELVAATELERIDTEAARARVADEHRQAVNELRSKHRQAVNELRSKHRQAEAALRASAAEDAARRTATERRAVESLATATQRIQAVKGSGAVRLGARLSAVRDRVRGRPAAGVDVALEAGLREIAEARTELEEALGRGPSEMLGLGTDEPPPPEEMARQRRAARARGDRAKVAVLAWDVGHNPFGRAHLLADLLRDRYDVELWGSQFERYGSDVWPPLRDTTIPIHRFPGTPFPDFLDTLDDAARRIDADAIYVSKPRLPSLGLGALAKESWNRPLLVDIDDFEPSFFDEADGIPVDELLDRGDDEDLTLPFGRLWTRACESVVRSADQLTVSNLELEDRYGGLLVPHARDETEFDPARHDRSEARRRLGLGDADRLILFGGTPRAHKGILDLLTALEELGDPHLRVGVFGTRELDDLRARIGSLERWILPLPYRAFDDLPGLLAAADLTCALQSPDHPVSRYQMPAKVTDAMAMGVPCLVTPVAPLQPLIDKDVVEVFDRDMALPDRIREILANTDETADRAQRAREVFLDSYSYAAVRPIAAAAVAHLLDSPPPPTPELGSLVTTARRLFRPDSVPTAAVRRRIAAGSSYDLVVFWKQNDTGIYGRRQDMFLKYLERSGRFHTIVHFDQPMSAEALLRVARRSVGTSDQNRLVLSQTLRRLTHRGDRGPLRQRTFLYAGGRASRALHLPRRDRYAEYVRSVLEREGIGKRPLMFWVYPTNAFFPDVADLVQPDVVVADVVDDNRTWYAPGDAMYEQLEQNYAAVLARSDLVLANCDPVAESMRVFAPGVEVVPNACELPDGHHDGGLPTDLVGIDAPIIGYAGNLSDRIDLPLLHELVRSRRDWSFVFLGSTHLDRAALALAEEPNVHFLGTKRYDDAQAIIRHFDVGLIPHLDNEMTRSMNPLKAYVYCALGVPIVSTPVANIGDMADFISIAEGADGFRDVIERVLGSGRPTLDREALIPHSWDERVDRVLKLVDLVVAARPEG
ncbi:MAG TPA: glycosyltransferase [Acidimicrobiia bacterium]|nr:glycosyltransferase [Acidimicrobiia bacterium]